MGSQFRFLFEKDVRLSFRIANLIMGDNLRLDYAIAFMNLKDIAESKDEDRYTAHNAIWKTRKVYNNLQETMLKSPSKIERK